MAYVTRYDIIIMLSVAWLVGIILACKMRELLPGTSSQAERMLLTFGLGACVALVAFCTVMISRLASDAF